jgi:hypothetical protein
MDRRGDGTLEEDEMRGRHVVFGRLFAALVALFALGIFAVSPAAAVDGDTLEVDLEALNDFDFNGTAVITEENGAITVEIAVEGVDVVGGHRSTSTSGPATSWIRTRPTPWPTSTRRASARRRSKV